MEEIRTRLDGIEVKPGDRETYREYPSYVNVKPRYVNILQVQKDAIRLPKVTRTEQRLFTHRLIEVAGGFRDTLHEAEQGCNARVVQLVCLAVLS